MTSRWLIIGFLLALMPLRASAMTADTLQRWGFSIGATPTNVIATDHYVRQWLRRKHGFSIDMQLLHVALPEDSDAFASDYGYPTLSLGVKYSINSVTMRRAESPDWGLLVPVDYDSHLGNIVSLYGSFTRPFFRFRHWEADYSLSFGVAYAHRKYALADNADDEFIGSRWLIYFGAGLHLTYRVAPDWGIRGGVEFFHHSNGALNRPNKGANYVGPSLSLVYSPYYNELLEAKKYRPPFKRYWYLNITAAVGAKTLDEDWQRTQFRTDPTEADYRTSRFHLYAAYSGRIDLMYRYARRWASGFGADIFYGSYSHHVADLDTDPNAKHSPWSFGLSAKHAAFWHNWSLDMSLGWYLFRRMGTAAKAVEKPYYEHVGLHYSFPTLGGLTVGINIKAHLTKADLTELAISWPIRL